MNENYNHNCIKCSTQYASNDVDPYYCKDCTDEKARIAKEVDKKYASIPRRPAMSELQMYDEIRKSKGTPFVNIKDLGIKL
jgi:uncharacterized Zn ribbon protein